MSVDRLVFEDRAYILDRGEEGGGRGINASKVIHGFGGKTLALMTAGGGSGEKMLKSIAGMGFPFESVPVASETRTNMTISDKQGLTIKLNEIGQPLSAAELKQIQQLVEARLGKAHWLMICGSIPPGVPPHYYCELIEMARKHGVKTLVDTEGDALLHSLEAKTHADHAQPTRRRSACWAEALITFRGQFLEALERIQKMGSESVILSLGSRGAIASCPEGVFEALPPHVDALCPIGAGDAMAAAFTWSMGKKKPFAEALRWGVAAGTAKAMLPGMTFPTLEQTRAVYRQVEVRAAQ